MFVYQNAEHEVCITFKDNKPVQNPEYVITVDKEAGTITVNGTEIAVAEADAEETDVATVVETVSDDVDEEAE